MCQLQTLRSVAAVLPGRECRLPALACAHLYPEFGGCARQLELSPLFNEDQQQDAFQHTAGCVSVLNSPSVGLVKVLDGSPLNTASHITRVQCDDACTIPISSHPAALSLKRSRCDVESCSSMHSPTCSGRSEYASLSELEVNNLLHLGETCKRQRLTDCDIISTVSLRTAQQDSGLRHDSQNRAGQNAADAVRRRLAASADMQRSIRMEKQKELRGKLNPEYLMTSGQPEASGDGGITPVVRTLTVSWLGEAASELELSQETLYLCISILDRFLSKSQGCPRHLLQLVAIAALSLAAKVEEVHPPSIEEMSELSANFFKVEEIVRMEFVLLDELEWHTRMPTAYSFMLLYHQLLPQISDKVVALALYLTELGLLYHEGLQFAGSTTAASALVVADIIVNAGANAEHILSATETTLPEIHPGLLFLCKVHRCAAVIPEDDDDTRPLALVREKYSTDKWCFASDCSTAAPVAGNVCVEMLQHLTC